MGTDDDETTVITSNNSTYSFQGTTIYFSFVQANGITHRLASTRRDLATNCYRSDDGAEGGRGRRQYRHPLILFLHGFPESWYSWRHQLVFFQEKPFLAVAPDMRGYGSTSQPHEVEAYTQPALAKDVTEIARALGYEQFLLVGHDWGSMLSWTVSLLYPERVLGVCGMSVPYAGPPKMGLLTMLQKKYGQCLEPEDDYNNTKNILTREMLQKAKFHYMLHHCLPGCAEEYNKNAKEFLYRIYAYSLGCQVEAGTPEHDLNGLMFPPTKSQRDDQSRVLDARNSPGLWKRLPRPKSLPSWLKQEDLDYYTREFERAGFHGGLCWYRALDRNFVLMNDSLRNKLGRIVPPSLFITGEDDDVITLYGGKQKVKDRLNSYLVQLTKGPIFIRGCGHWIQQEAANAVNEALLLFAHTAIRIQVSRSSKL